MSIVRWGVIGASNFADTRSIPGLTLAHNARLQAIMARDLARAQTLARSHGAAEAYDSVEALLASPHVDAVYVCTPVDLHSAHIQAAAEAGKHILCEKPMAMSLDDCRGMIETCARNHVRLGVGYMMRYRAQCQVARQLISEGKLGEVVTARAQNCFWYPEIKGAWRQNFARSQGGVLADVGVHCIDTLRFLLGETSEVQGVFGAQHFAYTVEDTAQAILRFESGALGTIDCSWAVPQRECPLELCGTEASLIITRGLGPFANPQMRLLNGEGEQEIALPSVNAYTMEFEAVSQAIADGRDPDVGGREGLRMTQILLAIYESARRGGGLVPTPVDIG